MWINYTFLALGGYFLGSIPTGFLMVKGLRGVDIRTLGSGNIGATNVTRVLGRKWGITCFSLDVFKGFIAAFFLPSLFFDINLDMARLVATVSVVAGHNWTCFLRFKGGKGVATAAGALLGMVPDVVLTCLIVWGVFILPFKMVSLSSIMASLAVPLFMWFYGKPQMYLILGILLATVSLYRHKSNIKRIWQGTENKIGTRIK